MKVSLYVKKECPVIRFGFEYRQRSVPPLSIIRRLASRRHDTSILSSSPLSVKPCGSELYSNMIFSPIFNVSATLKRYREAELTHGRVSMLAVVGFLVGEKVEGSSFLFDSQISGPAITHLSQVPPVFWALLTVAIGAAEQKRLETGWTDPADVPVSKPGMLNEDYYPGDIGFDPLGLKPSDPEELAIMQTKELQNGRLAMLAAAGFMAQELTNGQGILENLGF